MLNIIIKDTTFNKETGRFWSEVSYMNNAYNSTLIIKKERLNFLFENYLKLTEKFDLSNLEVFKQNLISMDTFYKIDYKYLLTQKGISHGFPKINIYNFQKEIIFYLLQDNFKIVYLDPNYKNNIDFLINLNKSGFNIVPFKTFALIETSESICFEIQYSNRKIVTDDLVKNENELL